MNSNKLEDIRKQYQMASLSESECGDDAIAQFEQWIEQAITAEVREATAMLLSTVDADHRPHARVVLLKGIQDGQFIFYTNYQSDKGQQLLANPAVALTFFWPQLERQVRIEGTVTKLDTQTSADYFRSRPRESQLSAWASPQSQVVNSQEELAANREAKRKEFAGSEELPLPPFWGGFLVAPQSIEFWQGRPNRLHDRIKYTANDKGIWKIKRLAP